MIADKSAIAVDRSAIASSRWLAAWKKRFSDVCQGVQSVGPYGGQGESKVGWECVVVSCGIVSCIGVVIAASLSVGMVIAASSLSMFAIGCSVLVISKVVVVASSSSTRGSVGGNVVIVLVIIV